MIDKKRKHYLRCLFVSLDSALNREKLAAELSEAEQHAAKAITVAIHAAIQVSDRKQ